LQRAGTKLPARCRNLTQRVIMLAVKIFEALCAGIAIYAGVKYLQDGRIPIANEGEEEPLAWLTGWEAKAASCLFIAIGLYLLAMAVGIID